MTMTLLPNLIAWPSLSLALQTQIQAAVPTASVVGLVTPSTQTDLAETIAALPPADYAVLPYGNGTKLDWGGMVDDARSIVAVSTTKVNQLLDHAVADMTVTVEAGMKLADLQATLAAAQQFLPIDPRFIAAGATVGGMIATGDSGSLRHRYGGVRDLILGVSFVRADGALVKAGGRVVKNVAGYDLMKLLTGSYGTLGIITQATLRTYPFQPMAQTLVLTGAVEALAAVAQSLLNSVLTPITVDWLSVQAMANLGLQSALGLVVRFESVPESVALQSQRLQAMAQAMNVSVIGDLPVDTVDLWRRIDAIGEVGAVICKIGVKGSAVVRVLGEIEQLVPEAKAIVHAASGLGRLVLPDVAAVEPIRGLCEATGGFLSVLVAPVEAKQGMDIWGMRSNVGNLMQTVKRKFDENNVLSPGRFFG